MLSPMQQTAATATDIWNDSAAVDELVKATKFTAAGPLVEARTRELLNGLARSLQSRGIDANAYLQLTGQ
mgnify:CR=1 FL=1